MFFDRDKTQAKMLERAGLKEFKGCFNVITSFVSHNEDYTVYRVRFIFERHSRTENILIEEGISEQRLLDFYNLENLKAVEDPTLGANDLTRTQWLLRKRVLFRLIETYDEVIRQYAIKEILEKKPH